MTLATNTYNVEDVRDAFGVVTSQRITVPGPLGAFPSVVEVPASFAVGVSLATIVNAVALQAVAAVTAGQSAAQALPRDRVKAIAQGAGSKVK